MVYNSACLEIKRAKGKRVEVDTVARLKGRHLNRFTLWHFKKKHSMNLRDNLKLTDSR